MDCVCGCGRNVSGKLAERNFIAASVALELLAWDKNRATVTPGREGREGLIARGAECYAQLLCSLHGEAVADPDEHCNGWLAESAGMRAGLSDLTKRRLLGKEPPNLSKADMEVLDRVHPEASFTGRTADAPAGAPADGDLVDKLERLGALRKDGLLTDEEFDLAKARLLGLG
jgi:hypothetical protein